MPRTRNLGRIVAIVAAILLAAVAAAAVYVYVQGIEQRAFQDAQLVEVLVAADEIPAGFDVESITEQGLITTGRAPMSTLPPGYVTSLQDLEGLLSNAVILEGEVISLGRFSTPDEVRRELVVPEGYEAISVAVNLPPGVAGYAQPGDRVSLIATIETPGQDGEGVASRSQYLLQGVEVLATSDAASEDLGASDDPGTQVLFTVAVQAADAERLVFTIEHGSLYFTLLPEEWEPTTTPGRTSENLFDEGS